MRALGPQGALVVAEGPLQPHNLVRGISEQIHLRQLARHDFVPSRRWDG